MTGACLLRDVVMVARDPGEQSPGLRHWHAHLADTALRRGDSKVGDLRHKRYSMKCERVCLHQCKWRSSAEA